MSQNPDKHEAIDTFLPPPAKLDLSIIPEGDEETRSRDGGDCDSFRFKKSMPKNCSIAKKTELNPSCGTGNLNMPAKSNKGNVGLATGVQDTLEQNPGKAVKRPFLRRGQGLAKYNLKPEDLKNPYRKGSIKNVISKEKVGQPKASSFAAKQLTLSKMVKQSPDGQQRSTSQLLKTSSLEIPMQRLVLSIPTQKPQSVEIGTWSQVFGGDAKISVGARSESTPRQPKVNLIPKQDVAKTSAIQLESRIGHFSSPTRRRYAVGKAESSPEVSPISIWKSVLVSSKGNHF